MVNLLLHIKSNMSECGGRIDRVQALRAGAREFGTRSSETNDLKMNTCCFISLNFGITRTGQELIS